MLTVLNDAQAEQARRDDMAKASAPFCHAKLNAVAVHDMSNTGSIGTVNVYAVPRGAQVRSDGRIEYPDGSVADPPALEPYTPTPDYTDLPLSEPAPDPPASVAVLPLDRRVPMLVIDNDDEPPAA
jgi:hypothetical protein